MITGLEGRGAHAFFSIPFDIPDEQKKTFFTKTLASHGFTLGTSLSV